MDPTHKNHCCQSDHSHHKHKAKDKEPQGQSDKGLSGPQDMTGTSPAHNHSHHVPQNDTHHGEHEHEQHAGHDHIHHAHTGHSPGHGHTRHPSPAHSAHAAHDHTHHIEIFKNRFWGSLILTIPVLLLSEMIQMWLGFKLRIPLHQYILFGLASLIYFYGGWPFLTGALDELKNKQPGMMTLIGTAISTAYFYSSTTVLFTAGKDFFWELATLIDIMLLGHWLEAKSVLGASRALEELVKIMPTNAHVLRNSAVIDVPVSALKKGDLVLVRPGEKVPSDGTVAEGESYVSEALLTGESRPVHKAKGHKAIGGSINGDGVLQIIIEKTGEETYLAQVLKLVRQAQQSRSRTQDLANRSAAVLFYVALVAGIISFSVWSILKSADFALERAVTVLVIACPHALGLAIPLVVAISTSITARKGILIRDRRAFEAVKDVKAVVFDKTGTLTEGQLTVSEVVSLSSEDELLKLTAAVEINSEHVIARAVVAYAQERGLSIPQGREFRALPGKGASAYVEGKLVYVGGANLLEELKIKLQDERLKKIRERGETAVFVIVDGQPRGAIVLSDRIRPESFEAIRRLRQMRVKVFMLTGDSEEVAKSVAGELAIDDYFAQVLPQEKAEKIKLLRERGYKVAMVGDGVNDAPALATADVGIAIGAGTDVAIESADLILVKNDPADVVKIIDLARKTFSKMVQNLWWAAGYNLITIPLAAGLLFKQGIVISPALGAVLMSMSTIIVALNSRTLRRENKERKEY